MKQIQLFFLILIIMCVTSNAQDITLPKPEKQGGKPLMEVLAARQSNRAYSPQYLSEQQLSNLLWAANGINREDNGKRTAPSARNCQEIDVYVFTEKGIFIYEPQEHYLKLIRSGDYRKDAAKQDFAAEAPILLIYVANYDKMTAYDDDGKAFYGATDCGNVSQNVYLYCASEELHTVAIGMINRDKIKELIGFNGKAILGQPVGFPK